MKLDLNVVESICNGISESKFEFCKLRPELPIGLHSSLGGMRDDLNTQEVLIKGVNQGQLDAYMRVMTAKGFLTRSGFVGDVDCWALTWSGHALYAWFEAKRNDPFGKKLKNFPRGYGQFPSDFS